MFWPKLLLHVLANAFNLPRHSAVSYSGFASLPSRCGDDGGEWGAVTWPTGRLEFEEGELRGGGGGGGELQVGLCSAIIVVSAFVDTSLVLHDEYIHWMSAPFIPQISLVDCRTSVPLWYLVVSQVLPVLKIWSSSIILLFCNQEAVAPHRTHQRVCNNYCTVSRLGRGVLMSNDLCFYVWLMHGKGITCNVQLLNGCVVTTMKCWACCSEKWGHVANNNFCVLSLKGPGV